MEDDVLKPLLAAVIGGLVGAMGATWAQFLENRAGARERREERLVDAAREFVIAATAWSEWLRTGYTNRRISNEEVLDENNERSKLRQAAYRKLQLHCSKQTFGWLTEVYIPVEYEVRKLAARPLVEQLNDIIVAEKEATAKEGTPAKGVPIPPRRLPTLTDSGDAALDAYGKLVGSELMDRCRAEVDALSRTENYLGRRRQAAS